ncbi:TCR/Tet family MFS transporter [Jannaschia seohaensis]|uniref:DHA1 family tetracycline resistance protein-like MFS transporter n=1 Tax=Jannaschia seohaensis TaxID=475081 RepID=A0A2Y9A337_9RHOB|nr:TCR/Tet family MFS transporter [Jannaschia seohaensis]PWJ22028.1 DHA1 family tetracycline resistance protein-like MFS transporter [Jannaschia seohaensis]SSA38306.1 MFS transporter, DHA1 family, tetracycline resistance protein [Jannaschia seohaensis]
MTLPAAEAPRDARLPILFVLITITVEAMGIGLILPVMPALLSEVQGVGLSGAALWGGVLASAYALMQFLFSPTLGSLSDRFGRRPVLLLSLAVIFVDYIVMALAQTFWLLLLGRVVAGIAAATMSVAMAFMADISPPEKKAQNFGLISAGFGLGFVLGPAIGGLLAEFGPRAPFWAAALLAGANLTFGLLVLPETLRRSRPFNWRRANPLGGLLAIRALPGLSVLLLVWFFYQVANYVYPAIWAYFTQAAFGWDARMVGVSLAVYGISMVAVQGGLIRVIVPRLGERRTLAWFLPYNAVILLCAAFVPAGWMMLALTPFSALGAVVAPALQGLASRIADDDQQGELQGVLASITAVASIISPLVMTQIFGWATAGEADMPGAPFLLSFVLMVVSGALYARDAPLPRAVASGP